MHPETSQLASLHVADFVSLHAANLWRRAFARERHEVDGLRWAKALMTLGVGRRGGFALGPLTVRRQLLIASWQTHAQFESFYASSLIDTAWERDCSRAWHVLMHPVRTRGSFRGVVPFGDLAGTEGDGPIAVLTLGRCTWRRLALFAREGARLISSILEADGLVTALTAGFPVTGNATFSLWQDTRSMLDFAYRPGMGHRATLEQDKRRGILREQIAARFIPHEVRGTWDIDMPGGKILRELLASGALPADAQAMDPLRMEP